MRSGITSSDISVAEQGVVLAEEIDNLWEAVWLLIALAYAGKDCILFCILMILIDLTYPFPVCECMCVRICICAFQAM
jgi:hypothetical protein